MLPLERVLKDAHADYEMLSDISNLDKATTGASHYGIALNEAAPTLILKTNDKFYAVIISGDTRISFKKLKTALNVKDIRMADPQEISNLTGAKIGEVSLINPNLTTLVDKRVLNNQYCYGGSGKPKTTLKINTADLVRITGATVLDFSDLRTAS